MNHRHLNHERFTIAAIEDILARGKIPDCSPLIAIIRNEPHGEVARKTEQLCERPLYAAAAFRRVIATARQSIPREVLAKLMKGKSAG